MIPIEPKNLYVTDWALEDLRCVDRMERLLRGMGRERSEVQVITAQDLPEVARQRHWIGEVRQGAYPNADDPDIIFNALRWFTPQQRQELTQTDLYKQVIAAHNTYGDCAQWFTGSRVLAMFGAAPFYHFERREKWDPKLVCWTLHDIHSGWGCVHHCAYCQRGSVYVLNLNVEEFVERVHQLVDENPWQQTFRYDVEQDVLPMEPEYGACKLLVESFAQRDDRYLILFSKSANVDHLLNLDHRGHTILLWTLAPHTVSRRYEGGTGTMEERIEAAAKCQAAGYPVRFKCKPIIPIRGWREELTHMLQTLYAHVTPDNLSMEMLFVDSVAELDATIGLENLDPKFVQWAKEAEAQYPDQWPHHLHGPRPFTFEAKAEVYRHLMTESQRLSPETPVTLCAETQRMWAALADVVSGTPWNYVCNCGPRCTPFARKLAPVEGPDAQRVAEAEKAGAVPAPPEAA